MVEAIAKHPFKATSDDELSFEKGDVVVVNVSILSVIMVIGHVGYV